MAVTPPRESPARRAWCAAVCAAALVLAVPGPGAVAQTDSTDPPPNGTPPTGVVNPASQSAAEALSALRGPIKEALKESEAANQARAQAEADAHARAAESVAARARFEEAKRTLVLRAQLDYVAPAHLPALIRDHASDPTRALEYLRVRLVSGANALAEARGSRARLEAAEEEAKKTAVEAQARAAVADATLGALTGLQLQQTQLAQGLEGSGYEGEELGVFLTAPPLVEAEGIVVNAAIGQRVADLVAAARAAGIGLGGSGYRTPGRQVELRRAHCGPTDFDVFSKPSNQCSPPTARPGRSMHERGLAIDFTDQGALIVSRDEPAFLWLAANAARYGLRNLASEPWHWSINGR